MQDQSDRYARPDRAKPCEFGRTAERSNKPFVAVGDACYIAVGDACYIAVGDASDRNETLPCFNG